MDPKTIALRLKEDLGFESTIIALKQVKEKPSNIEAYGDKNNICYMFREVLEERKTFYTIFEEHVCTLGCIATGLGSISNETINAEPAGSGDIHVGVNIYPSMEIQKKSEQEASRLFPKFKEEFQAIIIGPFEALPEADVLIMICTPEQVHLLTRAYCYATGRFVKGYAGMGVCRMLLPDAFLNKEPCYTVSDRSWRKALNIPPDKLTLATPPDKLVVMLENLDKSQV